MTGPEVITIRGTTPVCASIAMEAARIAFGRRYGGAHTLIAYDEATESTVRARTLVREGFSHRTLTVPYRRAAEALARYTVEFDRAIILFDAAKVPSEDIDQLVKDCGAVGATHIVLCYLEGRA